MKLTITIPKPCHENWNAMHAREDGRFCDSCQHTVADLTRATDAELVALLTGDARPKCARFDPRQLDRALGASEHQAPTRALPLAAFTSLVAIAAGQETFAQGNWNLRPAPSVGEPAISRPAPPPPMIKGKMMMAPAGLDTLDTVKYCNPIIGDTVVMREPDEPIPMIAMEGLSEEPDPRVREVDLPAHTVEMERMQFIDRVTLGQPMLVTPPQPQDTVEVCGTLVDEHGEPLPFAPVTLQGRSQGVNTEFDGTFRMRVPVDPNAPAVSLEIEYFGYLPVSRTFELPPDPDFAHPLISIDAPPSVAIDPKDPRGITGSVQDATTGRMIPDAVVSVKGTDVRVRCDLGGQFGLHVPQGSMDKPLTLEIIVNGSGRMDLPLSAGAVPCCVPVRFRAGSEEGSNSGQCHDLGTIRMSQGPYLVGDFEVVILDARKPTITERVTGPVKRAWHKLTR